MSATAGAGCEVAAGCGAGALVPGAGGVVPGGTPVVAVGPAAGGEPAGVEVAGAAAAALAQAPEARFWIASSSALGKSGAYWSMSLGTWRLASASCLADHLQRVDAARLAIGAEDVRERAGLRGRSDREQREQDGDERARSLHDVPLAS